MTSVADISEQIPDLSTLPVAVKRHALVHEVQQRLELYGKHQAGDFVTAGVSGGADSVALLLALAVLGQRTTHGGTVVVRPIAVHVHHHLRDSADHDAAFVEALCASLNVPFRMMDVDGGGQPGNVSATARALRYHALADQAAHDGAALVAVAHHAEDQFETMLMALCRGTGLDGLAGMPWVRSLKNNVQLIRPLLGVRRADCEDLCHAARVQWVDDPTNHDVTKSRAKLRHEVLPILETMWPKAAQRVTATAALVRTAAAALEQTLDESFGHAACHQWQRETIAALPLPALTAGLRRAVLHLSPGVADQLGHRQLDEAGRLIQSDDHEPKRLDWPGALRLVIDTNRVAIERKPN